MLIVLSQRHDTRFPLRWRETTGNGGHLDFFREFLAQVLRYIFCGIDKPAKDDGLKPFL